MKARKCESLQQILSAATLLESLYRNFVEVNPVNAEERRDISMDAAKRMALLAFQALQFKSVSFPSLSMRALRLNRRLLSPSILTRNLSKDRRELLLGGR